MYTRVKKSAELTMVRLALKCQIVRFKELISSSTNVSHGSSFSKEDLETALYLPLCLADEKSALNFSMSMVVVFCKWLIDSNAAARRGKVHVQFWWECVLPGWKDQDRHEIPSTMLDEVKEATYIVRSEW